jgi:hypothetical protein
VATVSFEQSFHHHVPSNRSTPVTLNLFESERPEIHSVVFVEKFVRGKRESCLRLTVKHKKKKGLLRGVGEKENAPSAGLSASVCQWDL